MQDSRTLSAAIAFAVAAHALSLDAHAQALSPKRDVSPRGAVGATGSVVKHEESAGGGIVYFEETGGIATATTKPVKANGNGHGKGADAAPKAAPLPPARAAAPEKK